MVELQPWRGPWRSDDPDANFKADVALFADVDPLGTLGNLSRALDIPVGALAHYVLAKWASAGAAGLLEVGPEFAVRLGRLCDDAERAGTDEARLEAYRALREILEWLRIPLEDR